MEVGILTESGNGKCEATNININEAIQNENYTTNTVQHHFPTFRTLPAIHGKIKFNILLTERNE